MGGLDGCDNDPHRDQHRAWLEGTRAWAEAALEEVLATLDTGPLRHGQAIRYALLGPGKRVRPALVRMACRHLGGDDAAAAPPAAAVEMVHAYSLVHDDLPAMDDDDLRRGRPTCHVAFGEAEAILVGDSLQAMAFEWLALRGGERAAELTAVLARGAGPAGMVGGQSLDLAGREGEAGAERVREIHTMKTAALLGAAAEMGAVAAGAGSGARGAMRAYGQALGQCFQAVDDVLDVTGDAAILGKTPGKDGADDKATLVVALGMGGARAEAERRAQEARAFAREAGCGEDSRAFALVDLVLGRSS